jgi:polyketide synthase PksN
MDLEFYSKDMPLGGLEYSIWNILQTLSEENCQVFSLGATFGLSEGQGESINPAVTSVLAGLQQQGAFDGKGNLQFKNKFRPSNTTLYLTRPATDDPEKVIDVIMMIADPFVENEAIESRAT